MFIGSMVVCGKVEFGLFSFSYHFQPLGLQMSIVFKTRKYYFGEKIAIHVVIWWVGRAGRQVRGLGSCL